MSRDWRAIIGMRDQLAHGYHKLDEEVIWNTAQSDLAPLRLAVEEMLKK